MNLNVVLAQEPGYPEMYSGHGELRELPDGSSWPTWPPTAAQLIEWRDRSMQAAVRDFQEEREPRCLVTALCDAPEGVVPAGRAPGATLLVLDFSPMAGSDVGKDIIGELLPQALRALRGLAVIFSSDAYVRAVPEERRDDATLGNMSLEEIRALPATEAVIVHGEILSEPTAILSCPYTRDDAGRIISVTENVAIQVDAEIAGRLTGLLRLRYQPAAEGVN